MLFLTKAGWKKRFEYIIFDCFLQIIVCLNDEWPFLNILWFFWHKYNVFRCWRVSTVDPRVFEHIETETFRSKKIEILFYLCLSKFYVMKYRECRQWVTASWKLLVYWQRSVNGLVSEAGWENIRGSKVFGLKRRELGKFGSLLYCKYANECDVISLSLCQWGLKSFFDKIKLI